MVTGASEPRSFFVCGLLALRSLRLTAPSGRHAPSTPTWGISTSPSVLRVSTAPLVTAAATFGTAATSPHSASIIVAAAIGIRAWAALLDPDLFSTDIVRVRCDSALVACGIHKFYEGAILECPY